MNTFSHQTLESLLVAAKNVLDSGASPELLREPIRRIEEMRHFRESRKGRAVIEAARKIYTDSSDDIEIDDGTIVHHNQDDGYWVMTWAFVSEDSMAELRINGLCSDK